MLRRQTYRFELRPSGQQLRNLRQFAGSCRFVYNKALALNTARYNKKEKRLGYAGLCALLPNWKKEHPFLSEVPAQALQALKNLERGYTNFFEKRSEFPKFKKKGQRESFRVPQGFGNGRIKLPKIGWLGYRKSQEVLGEAKNVTISESCGKWFVAVQTECEVETPLHRSASVVGLDWGVVRLYTLSNGAYREQCQPLKRFLPKLAKLQRRMAQKIKFSHNWKKAKAGIATSALPTSEKFLHRSSNEISKNHAVVFVEDLQVRRMCKSSKGTGKRVAQKSGLNRAILDGSPFELRRQLRYKTDWRGGLFYAVPPQNTSRTCPVAWGGCGQVSADNRKTQAKLVCLKCGLSANADFISAVNIREAGLASLACSQPSHAVSASWQEPTEGIHRLGVEPVGIPGR